MVKYSVNIIGEVNIPEGAIPIREDGYIVGWHTKTGDKIIVLEVTEETIILHRKHLESEVGTLFECSDS